MGGQRKQRQVDEAGNKGPRRNLVKSSRHEAHTSRRREMDTGQSRADPGADIKASQGVRGSELISPVSTRFLSWWSIFSLLRENHPNNSFDSPHCNRH